MNAIAKDRYSFPESMGLSQDPTLAYRLRINLNGIAVIMGSNVAAGDILSLSGYTRSAPSLSAYQAPEQNLSPELVARLNELFLLKRGWDDADALPISSEAVKEARNALRRLSLRKSFHSPSIVPTFDGFLQLEWHNAFRSLEFEYTPEGWSILGVDSVNTECPIYHSTSVLLTEVAALESYYIWFVTSGLIWPSR